MRKRYTVANWKMNVPPAGIDGYLDAIGGAGKGGAAMIIAPPYPYLAHVRSRLPEGIATAGQNCADHDKGAFTGEVAPGMLREAGAQYVILGHSERRSIYAETDAVIARKLALAIATGLTPILCIGESLRAREGGKTATILADQIRACASPSLDSAKEVILAYEPVWAIGTGRNATGPMVAETLTHVREALERFWPQRYAEGTPIL
ncbi:MAG TPA: triose-phosphate isomerase family protein, partial [Thermoanaerobaculia bacterium]|nr:triose-phosphate isomerase family protein [Thermoanaerobaculia bacterium]